MSMKILIFIVNLVHIRGNICEFYPELLCNDTLSDPRFLKTTSDRVIHIGVTLKIIQNRVHIFHFQEKYFAERR